MPLTMQQARDEVGAKVKAAVDAVVGLVAIWDDTKASPPSGDDADPQPWVRVLIRHVDGFQSSLVGEAGNRRFTRLGLLTMQLFTPFGGGLAENDSIASALRAAVEGVSTPNGVWFRNARVAEVGQDGPWFQTNVLAEFEYDELR